jgi:parallel beta-helix repeat protein
VSDSAPASLHRCCSRGGARRWAAGRLILLASVLALGLPAGAHAATQTLYVDQHDTNCSAAASGSADQPFCTIGTAAAKAGPGSTVVVAAGSYTETVKPPSGGTSESPLTFTAAPGATVVVTGTGQEQRAFNVAGLSWVTIKGFTVNGGAGILASDSSHIAVTGNRLTNPGVAIYLLNTTDSRVENNTMPFDPAHPGYGVYLNHSSRNWVAGNAISHAVFGIWLKEGARDNTIDLNVIHDSGRGIYGLVSPNTAIVRNVIFANAEYGIRIAAASYDASGTKLPGTSTRIVANTVSRNATGPSGADYQDINIDGSSDTLVANNVIDVGNGRSAIRVAPDSVAGTTIDNDVLNAPAGTRLVQWNDLSYYSLAKLNAATGQEAHGLQGDPRFAAPADGDFTLTPGSPAVDSALSGFVTTPSGSIGLPATDAFGGARVDDAATANSGGGPRRYDDRGAYEMRNPGFEADTAGWNTAGSSAGVTLTRGAIGHSGNGAAVLANTGPGPGTCALNDSPNWVRTTAAGTYTATVWVRADTPGATLKLRLQEWNGTTSLGQAKTTVALTTDWQPVSVSYTAALPGDSTLDLNAYVTGAPAGSCFSGDDASIALG